MLDHFSHVFMCLCKTKLVYLSAFEQFWANTGHKLPAKCEYPTSLPVRVELGQMSSTAAKLHSFEAQWGKCEGQKKRSSSSTFHWFKTHSGQEGKHRCT